MVLPRTTRNARKQGSECVRRTLLGERAFFVKSCGSLATHSDGVPWKARRVIFMRKYRGDGRDKAAHPRQRIGRRKPGRCFPFLLWATPFVLPLTGPRGEGSSYEPRERHETRGEDALAGTMQSGRSCWLDLLGQQLRRSLVAHLRSDARLAHSSSCPRICGAITFLLTACFRLSTTTIRGRVFFVSFVSFVGDILFLLRGLPP